ncbi:cyclic nucleotide-binding domain-containing protein [Agarilytica rhodophyticola]|uniref:cyclic nucleotide-binding domain-containing protein n=1 Tax=Agarilytica rhodophyticola TaxID=1737490 RepID=UPI001FECF820|nr:cyclic nucleotide-binding domain-containing protein [Agarilytica rhodophyticola]
MDINALKKFVPFSEIEDKYLEDALKHISLKTFNKGDMLFKRNRSVAERYYLISGRVDLIDARFESTPVEANTAKVTNALNLESPTVCSCIAKSGVEAFTIELEMLDRIVSWRESAAYANESDDTEMVTGEIEVSNIADHDATDWMSSLLQSPLFTKIPLTQVQDLFLRFKDVPAEAKEVVIKEGEKGDFFYVLASGRARVTNRSESVDVVLEPGSYFGEEALLGNTPRNATITMTESGHLKKLDAQDFEALLKEPVLQYVEQDELGTLGKPHKMLDVKMPMEYRMNHVPGSINVPLARLRSSINELAKSCAYVVPDDAGSRADIAAHLLCQAGFDAYILRAQSENR